jgi:3-hydroxyacyl-[acyl-carrier protein] dehydratase / trans-2-decenoyl-[acyl-carrier protein] isomerase
VVDINRVVLRQLKLAVAGGTVKADGEVVCTATNLTVGLVEVGALGSSQGISKQVGGKS